MSVIKVVSWVSLIKVVSWVSVIKVVNWYLVSVRVTHHSGMIPSRQHYVDVF